MTEFKTGTQSKKEREKHSGNVYSVVENGDHSIQYIVLKENDGNHIYYPSKGKVAQYLQLIQPGENLTFEAVSEVNGNKTIIWVLAWERVHKPIRGSEDAKKVAEEVVAQKQLPEGGEEKDPTPEEIKRVREYLEKQGEIFAGQLSEPKSKVPSFLTDSQKKERRIGYYSNLNTACEIVGAALSTYPTTGKDKAEPMNIPDVYAAVIQVAKFLHDWVEKQIEGGE